MKKPGKPPTLKLVQSTTTSTTQPHLRLGEHGRAFWDKTMSEYDITDCGGLEVLEQICATKDRAESLAAEVDRDGPTIMTKHGLREHPALRAELGCRAFITRNLQRLGLNVETLNKPGRPGGRGP